jgi:hypothetical protein
MLKRTSLAATLALATLVALPAASQAGHVKRDCLGLDRAGHHMVRAVDDAARAVVRVGDRLLGLLRCDKRRM